MAITDKTNPTAGMMPRSEYERRQMARRAEVRLHRRWESLTGNTRVVAFLTLVAVAYVAMRAGHLLLPWLLLTLTAFAAAIVWHRRVVRALTRAQRATRYYAAAVARLDDRWMGIGPSGERYNHPEHLYAKDLDLFGHGSLFQLLCSARTRMGQATLAAWLLESAGPETLCARQMAVKELRGNLDLREEMALLDSRIKTELDPQSLLAWIARPPMLMGRIRPVLAIICAVAAVTTFVGWVAFSTSLGWFLLVAILESILLASMRRQSRDMTKHCDTVLGQLELLFQVLRVMEAQRFSSPPLRELTARLHDGGRLPSRQIARLARLVEYWETARRNQFVAPLAFALMLPVHIAYAIERWRLGNAKSVANWLETVGDFEALCSFSGYAYEHPEQPFPEIVESGPRLAAKGLGHPLIPASRRVANDVSLGTPTQLLLVSGSNMSGKSTLLRIIGGNTVLALAGAPVCAAQMQLSRLAIASAMRNLDSLQEGVSGFYAEIQRLRGIRDLAAGPTPVLFLLDEILHGTNSHDRRVGAEAVITNLLEQDAIGLITTHDLALAEIADRLEPRAANVHFEDQLVDGRITFDYRLRPGVVPKGNGLVLMRLLGFKV